MGDLNIEHYADFGTREPWVARIMLGLKDLVYAIPAFASTREAFMNELAEVFESLGYAFQELRALRKMVETEAPALDVARSYASLYGYLWQAYKDRFQAGMKALGLDIGFMFQNDATFEKRAAELLTARPGLADIIELARHDRPHFQNDLAAYRNDYLEHRVEEPDPRLLEKFHRLDSAETTFENVWRAMEEYVVLYVIACAPPGVQVVQIPPEQRDPTRPIKFGFAFTIAPAGDDS